MVVRTKLKNPLPKGGFKICIYGRCLMCKHSIYIYVYIYIYSTEYIYTAQKISLLFGYPLPPRPGVELTTFGTKSPSTGSERETARPSRQDKILFSMAMKFSRHCPIQHGHWDRKYIIFCNTCIS
jgi:hypothetical protein